MFDIANDKHMYNNKLTDLLYHLYLATSRGAFLTQQFPIATAIIEVYKLITSLLCSLCQNMRKYYNISKEQGGHPLNRTLFPNEIAAVAKPLVKFMSCDTGYLHFSMYKFDLQCQTKL